MCGKTGKQRAVRYKAGGEIERKERDRGQTGKQTGGVGEKTGKQRAECGTGAQCVGTGAARCVGTKWGGRSATKQSRGIGNREGLGGGAHAGGSDQGIGGVG